MAGLLVSVRSAAEARAALAGGASVIDIKEPDRGPLGRATAATWQAVRQAVPAGIPLSAALGELVDWCGGGGESRGLDPIAVAGLTYLKLGLAGCGAGSAGSWRREWLAIRDASRVSAGPEWVVVIYADWQAANAPHPDEVVAFAAEAPCAGVLIDTWDKLTPNPVDASWAARLEELQRSGRFVALAGGLDEAAINRLRPLRPDLFAVRGAACAGANRLAAIEPDRVARLARAARGGEADLAASTAPRRPRASRAG